MKLREARNLAIRLMGDHGLISGGWKFGFDRARARFGYTQYDLKLITLSTVFSKMNDEQKVRNTILHEIAHALVGRGIGHGAQWRYKAVAIGCTGARCSQLVVAPKRPWIGSCEKHGVLKGCERFTRRENMHHLNCGGAITWIRNSEKQEVPS